VLHSEEPNRWQVVCEHLRCAPPTCSFPTLKDLGQRPILDGTFEADQDPKCKRPRRDKSPWIVEPRKGWQGIRSVPTEEEQTGTGTFVRIDGMSRREALASKKRHFYGQFGVVSPLKHRVQFWSRGCAFHQKGAPRRSRLYRRFVMQSGPILVRKIRSHHPSFKCARGGHRILSPP
jgi:hypothetical protein